MLPGWHTSRKLLVIESDDWGCWRIRDKKSNDLLLKKIPNLKIDPYFKYDALETPSDLESLFETLSAIRDHMGNSPVITANTIVANPDFEKIKASNFQEYYYKPYLEDLDGEVDRTRLPELLRQGMESGLYKPQLHGREHVNVAAWMEALRTNHQEMRFAFDLGYFGINPSDGSGGRRNFMAALNYKDFSETVAHLNLLSEGQILFNTMFGFPSSTFIAPAYYWHPKHEDGLYELGVRGMQGLPFQMVPQSDKPNSARKFRITRKPKKGKMTQLIRNVIFEPSQLEVSDLVGNCLSRIGESFKFGKPAIISSHRVNFMGYMEEKNRNQNLQTLSTILYRAKKSWPDIEFVSSDELIQIINGK
jgi:hypothetical protein